MSLLTDLDAFFTDHRDCGDLDGGVERASVVDVLVRGADRAAGGDVVILAVGVGAARSRPSALAMVAVIGWSA